MSYRSDKPVEVRSSCSGNEDTAPLPIGPVKGSAAGRARQGVVRNWLQNRLDLLLVAGCANAVVGIAAGVRWLQFVNQRPLFSFLEFVTIRLGAKALDATLFLLKVQNRALHRQLLRLKSDQAVEKIGDEPLRGVGVGIGFVDQGFDVLSDLRRALGDADNAFRSANEGHDGF